MVTKGRHNFPSPLDEDLVQTTNEYTNNTKIYGCLKSHISEKPNIYIYTYTGKFVYIILYIFMEWKWKHELFLQCPIVSYFFVIRFVSITYWKS